MLCHIRKFIRNSFLWSPTASAGWGGANKKEEVRERKKKESMVGGLGEENSRTDWGLGKKKKVRWGWGSLGEKKKAGGRENEIKQKKKAKCKTNNVDTTCTN
ncbi:unnamed protein product [Cuscuta europaea]|uniref:Uncharacterized protein n=1 Tax=Cuscuta europaea TaxID=41803 RepID=A0A9P0Z2N0_CUSEU|nr:unnamed protein product [Cuscuta europaea]